MLNILGLENATFLRRCLLLKLNGGFIFTATLYYKGGHHLKSTLCPIRYSQLWQISHPAKACQSQHVLLVTVDCTWWDRRCFLSDVNNSKSIILQRGASPQNHLISYQVQLTVTDRTTYKSSCWTECPISHSWLYLMGHNMHLRWCE